jgi:hypothetical protein
LEPADHASEAAEVTGLRARPAAVTALVLALVLTAGLVVSQGAAAKKKKGGVKPAVVQGSVGAIPNGPASTDVNPVPFLGTATVGKKFKGKTVGDVDVTISLTGAADPANNQCGSLCDITVRLIPPNGALTPVLFGGAFVGSVSGNLVSNLTLSDQTPIQTCGGLNLPPLAPPPPPCANPYATLGPPYTGTAQPGSPLNFVNGSAVKGTWTLQAFDICGRPACVDQGTVSVTGWSLKITPATAPR